MTRFLVGFAALVFLVLCWPITLGILGAVGGGGLYAIGRASQDPNTFGTALILLGFVAFGLYRRQQYNRNRAKLAGVEAVRREFR